MATHELDLSDVQEKSLAILTDQFNAPLLLQKPPGNVRTPDEHLTVMVTPVLDSMVAQAGVVVQAPIIEELRKVIAFGDAGKLQAVQDALGLKPLSADVDAAVAVEAVKK